jgi:hypothetical protein
MMLAWELETRLSDVVLAGARCTHSAAPKRESWRTQ